MTERGHLDDQSPNAVVGTALGRVPDAGGQGKRDEGAVECRGDHTW